MLLIPCPWCGPRPEIEFRHAGAAHVVRPSGEGIADEAWAAYLYLRDNPRGHTRERWRHVHGCGAFFNAVRDTMTDRIAVTCKPGEIPPADGAAETPGAA